MKDPRNISIRDYVYDLPTHRIALYPLEERDASKLLLYTDGHMHTKVYRDLPQLLPSGSRLFFNNSKVIRARLHFKTEHGAGVEIFCLEPDTRSGDYTEAMLQESESYWQCLVGGASKWKSGKLRSAIEKSGKRLLLMAEMKGRAGDAFMIHFTWEPADLSFAEVLYLAGDIPLPPYIKRSVVNEDEGRYQTVFADAPGSVAAPTAGLHFTDKLLANLEEAGMKKSFLTLHVGAGTFMPVKSATMDGHSMHTEWITVSTTLLLQVKEEGDQKVAVGTTSLRTLESIYWMGVKASIHPNAAHLTIWQWDVYTDPLQSVSMPLKEAVDALLAWMNLRKMEVLYTQTQLLIVPGYRFRVADWLITNFHQPQSTLLLLVAAAVGPDWKNMYQYALDHEYRFLSYGDGSLLKIRHMG